MMPRRDPRTNLALLDAMLGALARYLRGDGLARRLIVDLDGRRTATTLSLGAVVHTMAAVEHAADDLTPSERARFAALGEELRALFEEQGAEYREKLRRELKSHLDSWSWFLDECERRRADCMDDFATEVWLRTRIGEMLAHATELGVEVGDAGDRLTALDQRLRAIFQSGDYVGPAGDEDRFPPHAFWWLYGGPQPGS